MGKEVGQTEEGSRLHLGWSITTSSPFRDRGHVGQPPQQPKGGFPSPQGNSGPVAPYLVTGVECSEEHEGAGAGHVQGAVLGVEQLRAQEPDGDMVAVGLAQPCSTHSHTHTQPALSSDTRAQ